MTDKLMRIRVWGRWLRLLVRQQHDALTNKQRRRILLVIFMLFLLAGCLVLIHGCGHFDFQHIDPFTLNL